jgi:hypothetical protein
VELLGGVADEDERATLDEVGTTERLVEATEELEGIGVGLLRLINLVVLAGMLVVTGATVVLDVKLW